MDIAAPEYRGDPPNTGVEVDNKLTMPVAGRVSHRTASDLTLVARALGRSKSEVVADAVRAYLYGGAGTAAEPLS